MIFQSHINMSWFIHRIILLALLLAFGAGNAIGQSVLDCKPGCPHCQKVQKQVSKKSCCDKSAVMAHETGKKPSSPPPKRSCCQGMICSEMAQPSTTITGVGHFAIGLMHSPPLLPLANLAGFPYRFHILGSSTIPPHSPPLQQLYCVYLI